MVLTLEQQIEVLVNYLLTKVALKDWYGVYDAANDIRVLEAKIEAQADVKKSN